MKTRIAHLTWGGLVAALCMVLVAPVAMAAGILGTDHDFSSGTGPSATYKGTNTQVCVYCHTPHNATVAAPLWNRADNLATYTVYANPASLNATVGQPGSVSKLCLSCHDGAVAVDAFGGAGGTVSKKITGGANLGSALENDHPIGFTYNAALVTADGGLKNPATLTGVKLFADQMECASCHSVHDNTIPGFLRVTTAASALCTTCHNK